MTEKEYPSLLYKYLDADGGMKMLENKTLKFTLINNLNDPYDCFHVKPLVFETEHNGKPTTVGGMEEAYNYSFGNSVGICSLCENPLNFLMWSYYNQHRGVCLAIDMNIVNMGLIEHSPHDDIFFSLKRVKYIEEIPLLDIDEVINNEYNRWESFNRSQTELNNFLSTKASYWAHEKEYRLIMRKTPSFDPGEDHYEKVEACIKDIYLGYKLEPLYSRQYIEIARRKCIDIYYVFPDEEKFGIKFGKIDTSIDIESLSEDLS